MEIYCDRLARSLAVVVNILDPDAIVLGGGLSRMPQLYGRVPELWKNRYVFSEPQYIVTKLFRYGETEARTVSIEVGMQNGGMAASLAREHFPTMPLASAAAVFSGVMQNILGGLLAAWWKSRQTDLADTKPTPAGAEFSARNV